MWVINSLWSSMNRMLFFPHTFACIGVDTHQINETCYLTAIVNKAFDTRIWSNSLLNHRLWYQCWIKVWEIIHIGAKTIIHNIFIQNRKAIKKKFFRERIIWEIVDYSLFQIIWDLYPILAIYHNRYLISVNKN